jgi:hypothetical protein
MEERAMTDKAHEIDRRTALLTGAGVLGALSTVIPGGISAAADQLSSPDLSHARAALNKSAVEAALGKVGEMMPGGVLTFSLGREDLKTEVEGIKILPSFALAADIMFMSTGSSAMVHGEIPVYPSEVSATVSRVLDGGLLLTAVHNHRIQMNPQVMWVHFNGMGPSTKLAAAARHALPSNGARFSGGGASSAKSPLNAQLLGNVLGGDARVDDGGVIEVSVDRKDQFRVNGMPVPTSMGLQSTIYFQPLGGARAAIEGELVLIAKEVNPVVRVLRQRGIQIHALHNHMLTDQPHAFFLHTWSVGDSVTQARMLRAGLNLTNSAPPRAGGGMG